MGIKKYEDYFKKDDDEKKDGDEKKNNDDNYDVDETTSTPGANPNLIKIIGSAENSIVNLVINPTYIQFKQKDYDGDNMSITMDKVQLETLLALLPNIIKEKLS